MTSPAPDTHTRLSSSDFLVPPVTTRFYLAFDRVSDDTAQLLEETLPDLAKHAPFLAGYIDVTPTDGTLAFVPTPNVPLSFTIQTATLEQKSFSSEDSKQVFDIDAQQLPPLGIAAVGPKCPVFFAKLTRFPDSSGVLTIALSHNMGDAHSIGKIIQLWAALCRSRRQENVQTPELVWGAAPADWHAS
eukprot:GABV01002054.1.p1 GENE.GABV01002054.1~~GABV01002054.1.p1  ORF type:complete len:220 (-),score=56.88 GABV01002054.1:98-661(-)